MVKKLTPEQTHMLALLRECGLFWVATATESAWKRGERYYIDSRVFAPGLRRDFEKCNQQAAGVITNEFKRL